VPPPLPASPLTPEARPVPAAAPSRGPSEAMLSKPMRPQAPNSTAIPLAWYRHPLLRGPYPRRIQVGYSIARLRTTRHQTNLHAFGTHSRLRRNHKARGAVAGWVDRGQQQVLECLVEENRVLREQLRVIAHASAGTHLSNRRTVPPLTLSSREERGRLIERAAKALSSLS
jgi:hypothetical protein